MKELLTFLAIIALHETGHLIAAVLCGAEIKRFRPVFGGLRIEFEGVCRIPYFRELLIYSGGIAFNLLSLFLPFSGDAFSAYSIGTAVYNLLPFPGSDGGGIIYITALYFTGSAFFAKRLRIAAEDLGLLLLWCFSLYLNLTGRGSFPLLIAVVLLIIIRINKENRRIR